MRRRTSSNPLSNQLSRAAQYLRMSTEHQQYSIKNQRWLYMKNDIVVSASEARAKFGKLLNKSENEAVVIQRRGTPCAVLLGIHKYVRLAVREPEVLRILGKESRRKGRDKLTSDQIRHVIHTARRTTDR